MIHRPRHAVQSAASRRAFGGADLREARLDGQHQRDRERGGRRAESYDLAVAAATGDLKARVHLGQGQTRQAALLRRKRHA